MKVYTRAGDDGTTGLFLGGRVSKADPLMAACGDIDEAVATLGVARAAVAADPGLDAELGSGILRRQRGLFVAAADLATNPAHRDRLVADVSLVTEDMATDVEREIDERVAARPLRPVFVVPGTTQASAALDQARAVLRRAERSVVALADAGYPVSDPVRRYLNRLSDLLFVLARVAAGENEPPSHD